MVRFQTLLSASTCATTQREHEERGSAVGAGLEGRDRLEHLFGPSGGGGDGGRGGGGGGGGGRGNRRSRAITQEGNFALVVGRCRLTPGFHSRPSDCFQRLKPNYDNPVSNLAFNCNLRRYIVDDDEGMMRGLTLSRMGGSSTGRAVQVDPGFSQLTPRLLSALETN